MEVLHFSHHLLPFISSVLHNSVTVAPASEGRASYCRKWPSTGN